MRLKPFRNKIAFGLTLLSLVVWSTALSAAAQQDPLMGTWHLNIAKSTFHFSVAPKSNVHTYQPFGADGVRATADVEDAAGRKIHFTYSIKFDGKFYPVIGDPARDQTSLKRLDLYTGVGADTKDGRTLTVTLNGPKGTDIRVYEKQ